MRVIAISSFRLLLAATFTFTAMAAAPVLAQPYAASAQQTDASEAPSDPPSRAARLSFIDGAVSLQPSGIEEWNAAPLNQPLTSGDSLWSDSASHAEVDLGLATLRIGERTGVGLLDLQDAAIQLRLNAGNLEVTLNIDGTAVEIDAPNAAVLLLRPGEYRLDVDNGGNTSIAIRSGLAQVQSGEGQTTTLSTGQRGLYGTDGSYAVTPALAPDEFDRWCQQRQARWLESQAVARYVSSDVVGYEDLADEGQWQQLPDYGYVWFPTAVADDWAPYSTGHWAWVVPWGWTWVDDAPWGFAPFHYGRWIYLRRRWGWVPAPPHRHALYAPALVAWIGGPTVALGGGAAVGWLPLAPGEVYVPSYRASARYLQNVNLSNSSSLSAAEVTTVLANPALQNRYANRAIARAVTVVPQVNFATGQNVARHRMEVPAQLQSATAVARVPGILPERDSVLGALSLGRIGRPPASLWDRAVLTHRPPPPAAASFDLQQRALQANGGRPLDGAELRRLRPPESAQREVLAPVAGKASGSPYRGIPERAPSFQPPAQGLGPNVFRQREQALQQQHEELLREQQTAQPQPPQQPPQPRLQTQSAQQRQTPSPQNQAQPPAPQRPPAPVRRPAEPPPPPNSAQPVR